MCCFVRHASDYLHRFCKCHWCCKNIDFTLQILLFCKYSFCKRSTESVCFSFPFFVCLVCLKCWSCINVFTWWKTNTTQRAWPSYRSEVITETRTRIHFKDGVFMLCLVCGSVQLNPSSMTAACGSSGHV